MEYIAVINVAIIIIKRDMRLILFIIIISIIKSLEKKPLIKGSPIKLNEATVKIHQIKIKELEEVPILRMS